MKDLEDFRELSQKWAPFVRTCIRVAIAIRNAHHNTFQIAYAINVLSTHPRDPRFEEIDLETTSIRAIRKAITIPKGAESDFIAELLEAPHSFNLGSFQTTLPINDGFTKIFERMHPSRMPGASRLPTLVLTSLRQLPDISIEKLNSELLAHKTPYDGVSELMSELNIPIPRDDTNSLPVPTIEYIFIPLAELDFGPQFPSSLNDSSLSLNIKCHSDMIESRIQIGLKEFPIGGAKINRVSFSTEGADSEAIEDGFKLLKINRNLPNIALVQAILIYEGEALGRWWIRDLSKTSNPRLQIHRAIDEKNIFRLRFFEDKNSFEDRINLLLLLLGLTPLKYGQIPELTDAPDILALPNGGHLYVIECTTGDINNKGKLYRLHERSNKIRAALAQRPNSPSAIMPVIFTSLNRSETLAHRDIAANFQIAIVCRENIEGLLDRLEAPPSATELFEAASTLIPVKLAATK